MNMPKIANYGMKKGHHPETLALFKYIQKLDAENGNALLLKAGDNGTNGEFLMDLLDCYMTRTETKWVPYKIPATDDHFKYSLPIDKAIFSESYCNGVAIIVVHPFTHILHRNSPYNITVKFSTWCYDVHCAENEWQQKVEEIKRKIEQVYPGEFTTESIQAFEHEFKESYIK